MPKKWINSPWKSEAWFLINLQTPVRISGLKYCSSDRILRGLGNYWSSSICDETICNFIKFCKKNVISLDSHIIFDPDAHQLNNAFPQKLVKKFSLPNCISTASDCILTASRLYPDRIPTEYRLHPDCIPTKPECIPTVSRQCSDCIPTASRPYLDWIPPASRLHPDSIPTVFSHHYHLLTLKVVNVMWDLQVQKTGTFLEP